MSTYKKLKDSTFERTDSKQTKTILDKEQLEREKKRLGEKITKLQGDLDFVNENLEGIKKAK